MDNPESTEPFDEEEFLAKFDAQNIDIEVS